MNANLMKPHGCHNMPMLDGHYVQDGWVESDVNGQKVRLPKMVFIKNVMTTTCNYDKRAEDARCAGCTK